MKPHTDTGCAHSEAEEAYVALREHCSGSSYQAVVTWIEALAVQQQAEMASCKPEKLVNAQVRLRQLVALRDALTAPADRAGTGHVCD